jgi:hypothetical protein
MTATPGCPPARSDVTDQGSDIVGRLRLGEESAYAEIVTAWSPAMPGTSSKATAASSRPPPPAVNYVGRPEGAEATKDPTIRAALPHACPEALTPTAKGTGVCLVSLAVAEGFEPSEAFTSHAFEACSLGRSDTPPPGRLPKPFG